MIAVDISAFLAILLLEPDAEIFLSEVGGRRCLVSAVNAYETATVLRIRRGPSAVDRLWRLLAEHNVEIVAFDNMQARAAAMAYGRFGKGIHPRARLNICDCAAYALAKTRDVPLLFKGDDFPHTDIVAAV